MTLATPSPRAPAEERLSHLTPRNIDRPSTSGALAEELRRQILSGQIPAGSRLREAEIAEAFRVSRQSLRAALAELVHEGILRHAPNKGVWVPKLSADDIRDVYDMRGLIEGEAAARLARRPAAAMPVWAALGRLEQYARESDTPNLGGAHTAFHQALTDSARSPRLSRTFQLLRSECELSLIASHPSPGSVPTELAANHRELLETILAGTPHAARRAAAAHLASGMRTALAAVADDDDWRLPVSR